MKYFKNTLRLGLILSLLLHISFATSVYFSSYFKFPETAKKEYIEITLDPQLHLNEEDLKQIVQQNKKPLNNEVSEKSKYLGQHNQRVEEETRAQMRGDFNNNAGKDPYSKLNQNSQQAKKSKSSLAENKKGKITLDQLKPSFEWDQMGQSNSGNQASAASQTDDYLKNIKTGPQTLLNTREFIYYSYYNRIREQLKQHWEPKIKEKVKKIFQQGRKIAADTDRITKVIIVLDEKGILKRVQVIGASGVSDLDEAAVEAFKAAAPFPNPPKGIVDADGYIKIRWDFILEA